MAHRPQRIIQTYRKYVSSQKGMVLSKETSSHLFSLLLKRRGYSVSPHDENYCFTSEIFFLANLWPFYHSNILLLGYKLFLNSFLLHFFGGGRCICKYGFRVWPRDTAVLFQSKSAAAETVHNLQPIHTQDVPQTNLPRCYYTWANTQANAWAVRTLHIHN